jgi:hypothetical protein
MPVKYTTNKLYFLIFALSIGLISHAQSWSIVGNPGFSAGNAYYQAIAIDHNNVPYVAYQDASQSYAVTAMKYNGTNWTTVGSAGFTPIDAATVSLAINSTNVIYAGFIDASASGHSTVSLMQYSAGSWAYLGTPHFTDSVLSMAMAIGKKDTVFIAYIDAPNSSEVTVMKYNGTSWVNVGTPDFSVPTDDIALAIDTATNTPYVAFSDFSNGDNATVEKYNGGSWTVVGATDFSAGNVSSLSIVIDKNGAPIVAYQDGGNSSLATVMKFTSGSWNNLGTAGFSAGTATYTSLALDSANKPFVAYQDAGNGDALTVEEYNGASWVAVGSRGCSAGTADYTSLAIDSHGKLYVTFQDGVNLSGTTVVSYNHCNAGNPVITVSDNGKDTVCTGQKAYLTASGANMYIWSTGDSNASAEPVLNDSNTVYRFYVTGIAANGCESSDSIDIHMLAGLQVNITGSDSICRGAFTTITASGATSYSWNTGSTQNSISVNPSADSTYYVVGKNSKGCTDTVYNRVIVDPGPSLIIVSNDTVCLGDSTTLEVVNGNTYLWSNGLTNTAISVMPVRDSTFYVLSADNAGCTDTAFQLIKVLHGPAISISGKDTICSGDSTVLTANGGLNYVWMPGNSTNTSINVKTTVNENVVLTSMGLFGCKSRDSVTVVVHVCTGIDEIEFPKLITVGPNPATNDIYLSSYTDLSNAVMEVYNISGQVMSRVHIGNLFAGDRYGLSVKLLGAGMYYIRLTADQGTMVNKFVKE